jgi:PPM family protein phosphatase
MAWHRLNTAIDQAQRLFREPYDGMVVRTAGRTDVGSVRKQNEDAFIIADLSTGRMGLDASGARFPVGQSGVILAVSDGMGGAAAGEIASALVVDSLLYHLEGTCKDDDPARSLECAVEFANREVWDAAQTKGRAGMGATLVAVMIGRGIAHIASVGDSRAYLVRAGRIRQLTKDHSYVQMLVDAQVLSADEAATSPYRNIILQAMGTKPEVTVAMSRLELRRGDRFLLCSDGLSEKVLENEMVEIVERSASYATACARLVELANERGGDDNITAIIADVSGEELPRAHRDERDLAFQVLREFALK